MVGWASTDLLRLTEELGVTVGGLCIAQSYTGVFFGQCWTCEQMVEAILWGLRPPIVLLRDHG